MLILLISASVGVGLYLVLVKPKSSTCVDDCTACTDESSCTISRCDWSDGKCIIKSTECSNDCTACTDESSCTTANCDWSGGKCSIKSSECSNDCTTCMSEDLCTSAKCVWSDGKCSPPSTEDTGWVCDSGKCVETPCDKYGESVCWEDKETCGYNCNQGEDYLFVVSADGAYECDKADNSQDDCKDGANLGGYAYKDGKTVLVNPTDSRQCYINDQGGVRKCFSDAVNKNVGSLVNLGNLAKNLDIYTRLSHNVDGEDCSVTDSGKYCCKGIMDDTLCLKEQSDSTKAIEFSSTCWLGKDSCMKGEQTYPTG